MAFRKSIEDELEVLLARTEEDEPPPPPWYSIPEHPDDKYPPNEPLPGYQSVTIQFWTPSLKDDVLVGIMRADPAYTLQNLQEFVAENIVGKDPNGNPGDIPAKELKFKRLDLEMKKKGINIWIPVRDGVVPDWKDHKKFRVTWHKKLWGIFPQRGKFFKHTRWKGVPNGPAAVPSVKGGSLPVELGSSSSQKKLDDDLYEDKAWVR